MRKYLFAVTMLLFAMSSVYARGIEQSQNQAPDDGSPVSRLDNAVRILAENLNRKLIEERAEKIAIGQFAYRGTTVPLGAYWVNQLTGELANKPYKPYIILSGGPAGADWTVSGEIIEIPDAFRIYTRLVRMEDRAIKASFYSDFEMDEQIIGMLFTEESRGGRSSPEAMDSFEPDSFDNPVLYEIGADSNTQIVNRTLHNGDEDFFLLISETDGQLIMETTGRVDTYMEFYNADTREKLDQNDDGGSGENARIRYSAQAGKRYIAKIRGYDSNDTGEYGFRAYLTIRASSGSFDAPLSYEIGSDENVPVINLTLERDDEHFFLLLPETDGQLIMETTGSVDTYMEFYNAQTRQKLAEDDDGGRGGNARIRYGVQAGNRYVAKVLGCDSSDYGEYGFRAYIQAQIRFDPDEYEPDDDSTSAKQIEIGTSQQRTFHNSNDVDWVKFQITRPGRYVIRTRGLSSNNLDTYIELYDSKINSIDDNDDGGDGLDSRLSLHLESGLYYLKVECLDETPNQPYVISVEAE